MTARLSLVGASLLMSSSLFAADTLSAAISEGKFSGGVRALYSYSDFDAHGAFEDRYSVATGIRLSYETALLYGIQAKASLYSVSGMGLNSDNPNKVNSVYFQNTQRGGSNTESVYGTSAESYAVLGEAYLKAAFGKTFVQIGRMEIDAPFASSHDIYVVPNTFEAAQIVNVSIPNTTLVAAHATKMSGPDMVQSNSFAGSSTGIKASDFVSISKATAFNHLSDGDGRLDTVDDNAGATVVGGIYTGVPGVVLQGWYTRVWDIMDMPHLQIDYRTNVADIGLFAGAWWAAQSAIGGTKDTLDHPVLYNSPFGPNTNPLIALGISNIDAKHMEAKIGGSYKGATVTLAYANTKGIDDNAARGGFVAPVGGNPSWVRTRYQSPHFGYTDTSSFTGGTNSYLIGLEYDFGLIGINGLKSELKYLHFSRDGKYSASPGLLYYKPNAYEDTDAIEASVDYKTLFGVKGLDGGITVLSVNNDDAAGNASTDHTDLRVALNLAF